MWSSTVQQEADIIKLQNTKKANLTNFSYVVLLHVLFLCHFANSPHYSTFRRMPERTSSIASYFLRRKPRAHLRNSVADRGNIALGLR